MDDLDARAREVEIDQMARELEQDMIGEAIQRLKTIKPDHPDLAEAFDQDGTIHVQDISLYTDEKKRLRKATKAEMDLVHYVEDTHALLPYFIISEVIGINTVYYLFYVNWDKKMWGIERSSLQAYGRPYSEPYVFQVNAGFREEDDETPIDTLLSKFTMTHMRFG